MAVVRGNGLSVVLSVHATTAGFCFLAAMCFGAAHYRDEAGDRERKIYLILSYLLLSDLLPNLHLVIFVLI